jgi:hypothetical protein
MPQGRQVIDSLFICGGLLNNFIELLYGSFVIVINVEKRVYFKWKNFMH